MFEHLFFGFWREEQFGCVQRPLYERKTMNRQHVLKLLNPVLALLFVNQIVTGMSGTSLSHEAFEILHKGGAIILSLAVATHVILNGNWIKAQYFRKRNHV